MRLAIHLLLLIIVSQFASLSFAKKSAKKKFYEGYKVEFDYQNYPHEREIAYQWYLDVESQYLTGMTRNDIGNDKYLQRPYATFDSILIEPLMRRYCSQRNIPQNESNNQHKMFYCHLPY